jgi:hypothetical protein
MAIQVIAGSILTLYESGFVPKYRELLIRLIKTAYLSRRVVQTGSGITVHDIPDVQ